MNDPIPVFTFTTTPLELVSFVLSVMTVLLNIRQIHWAWLFSIVSSGLYALVFFESKLYGDMGLQFVFIAVSAWGWMQWLRGGRAEGAGPAGVTRMAAGERGAAILGWAAGFLLLAFFLDRYTDTDVPYVDGFLTAGSLLGQLLLSRKKLENWHVWIVVDILYVGLYLYKHLILTAMLYALFVVLAVIGLRTWRKAAQHAGPAPALV